MKNESTEALPNARGMRFVVIVSRYHTQVTGALERGALDILARCGGDVAAQEVVDAPGSFELGVIAAAALARPEIDGVVAIGCILKGETPHNEYIAGPLATALMNLSVQHRKPVAFGVLTPNTIEQALARAGGSAGNKGEEAMLAAIRATLAVRAQIRT